MKDLKLTWDEIKAEHGVDILTFNPKEGDVIILQLPSDEHGVLIAYDYAIAYHKALMEAFPNNNVLTIPDMCKITEMSDEAFNRYVDSMIKMRKGEGIKLD